MFLCLKPPEQAKTNVNKLLEVWQHNTPGGEVRGQDSRSPNHLRLVDTRDVPTALRLNVRR